MSDEKSTRGGARKGAGRKPLYDEPMTRLKVTIPPPMKKMIRDLGDGNKSKGVRRLVHHYLETNGPKARELQAEYSLNNPNEDE